MNSLGLRDSIIQTTEVANNFLLTELVLSCQKYLQIIKQARGTQFKKINVNIKDLEQTKVINMPQQESNLNEGK